MTHNKSETIKKQTESMSPEHVRNQSIDDSINQRISLIREVDSMNTSGPCTPRELAVTNASSASPPLKGRANRVIGV
eukprot:CAMPEP_0114591962 /NCGR_PEP_ID=MMETSP0125-20121206/13911_1 /TAXON_ID=485358 ORGANISM="Aristerostoma sp., Strain ATCC 50986" /NCGR_SAMPLE_ID=MMETSP0125 /ASSEMBLY_ACC=CAM_ASM_000245 /LENGTH=76 /DNA_ID=CAMNT_0001790375 /DNA_START=1922 /DNA_END=2152 /DNA_ORIENTATION=+